ncbi:MAG: Ig-like domain-containing protein [Pyrinomonadaceae bacterium]
MGSSGNAPGATEFVTLDNPAGGIYTVAAAPFAPSPGVPGSYAGRAELVKVPTPPPAPPPGTEPVSYFNHVAPAPLGRPSSDEPSIGINWKSDKAMFVGSLDTYQVTFDDCTSPAMATWKDRSFITTSLISLDPILFTDRLTGRTIVSQLSAKCSSMAFTDNDGGPDSDTTNDYTPSMGCGINSGVDHQTVGGGPFAAPLTRNPNGPLYPNAVYYCSQDVALAQCARSDTGGLTFGPAVPIYDLTECGGLHGHVKVAPDGTVYVPNKGCNGEQAAVVSENNGITWDVRPVPGALPGETDPSIGIATNGNVYFGWDNGGVQPKISVSTDKGLTWSNPVDAGAGFNITNTAFPAVVAGDPDRAAFAFHGCPGCPPGGLGDDPNYPGDWFLFVAHTYDRGATWTTVNVTPNDPVQRATICTAGINCNNGTRNLLDFFGAEVDRQGRVLVGYADGCVGNCVNARPNSFTAVSTIARQVNGRRLFAQFDTVTVPAAPLVTATFNACPNPSAVILTWSPPDDHGSPITSYKIYRRTGTSGSFALLATVPGNVNKYSDNTINPTLTYFYRVTALNARGEGAACSEVSATCPGGGQPEDPCVFPGVTVLTDATGDFTLPVGMQSIFGPALDLQKLSIAEPFNLGPGKLMFVLKVASLQNVPPETTWPILFRSPTSPTATDFAARMHTNALGQVFFTVATGANNVNPVLNPGVPADAASSFSTDGTIRIVVSRAAIGNPAPNQVLDMFLVRVRSPEGGATATTPDNMPDSLARTGSYTLKGSENCQAPNRPPDAVDDSATTTRNTPVVINVVANDSDPDLDPLTVTAVSDPPHGTATNNNNGTVTYRPDNGFIGSDSFTYTISDGRGGFDTATVRVTVNPPGNRPPDAVDDTATTCKNRPKRINVLANDRDPDGDPLTVGAVTQPANGSVVINSDNTVTYTPRRGFVGTDSFTYTISDGRGGSDTARVTVTVGRCDGDEDDDDDFDDDGDRDDHDIDDDNDGVHDDRDIDDDNDGDRDDQDSDDDNDNIDDEFDNESTKESQHSSSPSYAGGSQTDSVIVVDANTLLLTALVEAADAQNLTVEIYDPSGLMVARSVATPGRALAVAPVRSPGNYTVRVRNNGTVTVPSSTVLITSSRWLNLGAAVYRPFGKDSNALVIENIKYLALRVALGAVPNRLA